MEIYLAYAYYPHTTAVYFERALEKMGHRVHYVGIPHADNHGWYGSPTEATRPRAGYPPNVDLARLAEMGMPHPDLVLYVDAGERYFPRGLDVIDAPTACYLIDVHRNIKLELAVSRFFDHVFVAQRDYLGQFREVCSGASVEWLPLACDPEIHAGDSTEIKYEVGFVGNVSGEAERRRRLELLDGEFRLNDWRVTRPKEEIAGIYSASATVFNASVDGDLNMRVFEGMASGRPLVTDRIENGLDELFVEGEHYLGYSSDAEMREKIRWCLENAEAAGEIGRAAQELVLREHSYENRCEEIIESAHGSGSSPVRSLGDADRHGEYARVYSMLRAVDPAMDELADAWVGAGRWRVASSVVSAIARRVNLISGASTRIRQMGRPRG